MDAQGRNFVDLLAVLRVLPEGEGLAIGSAERLTTVKKFQQARLPDGLTDTYCFGANQPSLADRMLACAGLWNQRER